MLRAADSFPDNFELFLSSLRESHEARSFKTIIDRYIPENINKINDLEKFISLFKVILVHKSIINEALSSEMMELIFARIKKIIDDPVLQIKLSDVCNIFDSISKISDIEESVILKELVKSFIKVINIKSGYLGYLQATKLINAFARIGVTKSSFTEVNNIWKICSKKIYDNILRNKHKISDQQLSFLLLSLIKIERGDDNYRPSNLVNDLMTELKSRFTGYGKLDINQESINSLVTANMSLEFSGVDNFFNHDEIALLSRDFEEDLSISFGQEKLNHFLERLGFELSSEFPLYKTCPFVRRVDAFVDGDVSLLERQGRLLSASEVVTAGASAFAGAGAGGGAGAGAGAGGGAGARAGAGGGAGARAGAGAGGAGASAGAAGASLSLPSRVKDVSFDAELSSYLGSQFRLLLEYDGKTHYNRLGNPNSVTRFRNWLNNLYAKNLADHERGLLVMTATIKDENFFKFGFKKKKEEFYRSLSFARTYFSRPELEVVEPAKDSVASEVVEVAKPGAIAIDDRLIPISERVFNQCLDLNKKVPDATLNILLSYCKVSDLRLEDVIKLNKFNVLQSLIKNGLDINLQIEEKSLLKIAIENHQYKTAAILMIAGLRDEELFNVENIRNIYQFLKSEATASENSEFLEFHYIILTNFDYREFEIDIKSLLREAISGKDNLIALHILENYHDQFSKIEMNSLIDNALAAKVDDNILECLIDANYKVSLRESAASAEGAGSLATVATEEDRASSRVASLIENLFKASLQEGSPIIIKFLLDLYPHLAKNKIGQEIEHKTLELYEDEEAIVSEFLIGFTYPLIVAVDSGCNEVFKLLAAVEGVDLDIKRSDDVSAFIIACSKGNSEIVEFLMKGGVNINNRSSQGLTGLILAAKNNHVKIVKKLMDSPEIDLNAQDCNGNTAFFTAASMQNIETVKLMISYEGVDVDLPNSFGLPAIAIMMGNSNFEMVNLLLDSRRVSEESKIEAIKVFCTISHDQDLDQEEIFKAMSRLLLEVECSKQFLDIILEKAIFLNNKKLCKLLLEKGANPMIEKDKSPLFEFILRNRDDEFVEVFLEKINISEEQDLIDRSLEYAVMEGKLSLAKLLLKYGANPMIEKDESLLFEFVLRNRGDEFVKVFLEKINISKEQDLIDLSLIYAAMEGKLSLVNLLLEYGAQQFATESESGNTALTFACQEGYSEVVRALLEDLKAKEKVDIVNKVNRNQDTPLIKACGFGHVEIAKMLINFGANYKILNKNGLGAINYAYEISNQNQLGATDDGSARDIFREIMEEINKKDPRTAIAIRCIKEASDSLASGSLKRK